MAWQHTLRARWATLVPREQRGLALAALVVALALVWGIGVRPALRTLATAPAQQAAAQQQLEAMQALQARAQKLQAQPALSAQDAVRSLQAAATALTPPAELQLQGDRATLQLQGVAPGALASWLSAQAQSGSGPVQAQLVRDTNATQATWSGTLTFRLPGGSNAP